MEFVGAASASLRRTAFLVCGDRHKADDIVQDTLCKLSVSWPKVRRVENPFSYVRRMVVNAAYDRGRTGSKSTFTGWGRVASNATTVRLQMGSGPTHEVPVNDGWFAVAWAKPTEAGGDFGVLKAYDKNGKLVRVISQN